MQNRGTVFISFIELVFDTNWIEVPKKEWESNLDTRRMSYFLGQGWALFKAEHPAELQLVEPEATRKWMQFKPKAIVAVGYQTIRYEDSDFDHELTVNEDEQLKT
jgi:hypothetical protein